MTKKTVAVWEYQSNDIDWIPYCAEVCHQLERAACNNLTKLYLGDVDASLSAYVINIARQQQINSHTGTTRSIRRRLYSLTQGSVGYTVGIGIRWLWLADQFGHWCSYPTDIQHLIESAYRQSLAEVDLETFSNKLPYVIHFSTMSQVRKGTGTSRPLKRSVTRSYPYAKPETTSESSSSSNDSQSKVPAEESSQASESTSQTFKQRFTRSFKKKAKKESESDSSLSPTIGSKIFSWMKTSLTPNANTSTDNSNVDNQVASTSSKGKSKGKTKGKLSNRRSSIGSKPVIVKNHKTVIDENLDINKVLEEYTTVVQNPPTEDCIICCEELTTSSSYGDDNSVLQFTKCDHKFHRACLKAMISSANLKSYIQCPTCKVIYGKKIGIQPEGTMKYYGFQHSLDGYPNCKTICIYYDFRDGVQGSDHPQPGQPYTAFGFPRVCYLPDNEQGRKVLRMLCVAWQRRLTFTIGTSITTGYSNVVTWNEIHHKTEFGSNYSGHGYPDPHYFDNVLLELASHGIMEDDPDVEDF